MTAKSLAVLLALSLAVPSGIPVPQAQQPAQAKGGKPAFTPQQLEELTAPIALYPDALLAEMLTCSQNYFELKDPGEWLNKNSQLKGSAVQEADLHLGPRFRVFTEFQSGIINGQLRSARPTDRNIADFHQAFLEWRQPITGISVFGVKAGRRELSIGSSRLISASPGLSVKRSFNGALLYFRTSAWRISATVAKLNSINPGAFDDRVDSQQTFWVLQSAGGLHVSRMGSRISIIWVSIVPMANSSRVRGGICGIHWV